MPTPITRGALSRPIHSPAGGSAALGLLSTTDRAAAITLSADLRQASVASGSGAVRAARPLSLTRRSVVRFYVATISSQGVVVGLGLASSPLTASSGDAGSGGVGFSASGAITVNGSYLSSGGEFGAGATVTAWFYPSNGHVFFAVNGVIQGNPDPYADVNPQATLAVGHAYYPMIWLAAGCSACLGGAPVDWDIVA